MRRFLLATPIALFLLSASLAYGQTTGDIIGRVLDDQGGVLPGVSVEARSAAFQGVRTSVTDAAGIYRLVLLPPGSYRVSATLQGFARVEETVVVSLAKTSTLDLKLSAAATAEVTVLGEAPVVDTTSTAMGTNFDNRQIKTLPTGRNYSAVVLVAPGVTTQTSNTETFANTIAVYGSTGLENSFIIDGADTTGVEYGSQGKDLNFEFIQEVDVKTGGYQAEYGRATGGIVNVITKSGGNEFHGDIFGYYTACGFERSLEGFTQTGCLQAENRFPDESLYGTNLGYTRYDWGADLGGFLWKDRIWIFGAYDRVNNNVTQELSTGPLAGEIVKSPSLRNLASGKLTFMLNASNSVVGSFFMDPRTDSGAINDGAHTLNGEPPTFLGRQDLGGQDWAARYNGLFGNSWVATAQFALHQERNSVGPATALGNDIEYIDARPGANNFQTGGFGLIQNKKFKRWFYGGSLTKYLANHELKAGFEFENQTALVTKRFSGGQQVRIIDNPGDPSSPVYRHFYWSVPGASVPDNVPISQLNATPGHKMLTAYLQDSWAVLPNLSVNLGVRWDEQKIYDSNGVKQIDLQDDFAPRIGVIWDPTKDNRTKVWGSFGYFYEQIPMDLVIRSFSYEQQPVIYNFDPVGLELNEDAAIIADDGGAIDQGGGKVLGGFTEPSDPNIKGQYVREFLFGVEREVMTNWAVGARYIYRNLGRVIEDFLCDTEGTYCIGNPSFGIMENILTLDYSGQTFAAPKPQRIYRGVQLDVTKRFADNWSMSASYIWSNLTGNYDGGFSPYTQPRGTADPNISAAYDYYDFFTQGPVTNGVAYPFTASGPLSNDRTHQVKVYGTYVAPFNLNVGLSGYFRTGTPFTRLGYSTAYDRYEFFLTRRGGDGRVPSDYEMDLHLGYPLQLGPVTVNAMVDIFQILNVQRATFLEEAYNTQEFTDPNYVCGSGGAEEDSCNSYYGQPLARTAPRSFRFGLRVSF